MLSDGALTYLCQLKYAPDAERLSCMLPLGGIYWADEIPDFRALMDIPKSDRELIFRLFSIRFRLWDGDTLSTDDQSYWDVAQKMVPDCPVLHRVELSEEDRAAQSAVEREAMAGLEALIDGADDLKVSDDGSFSVTFDLNRGLWKSFWHRFLAWCRGR